MFEVSSDIYFVVYNLYYIGQNDDLGARVGPIHRDGGSTNVYHIFPRLIRRRFYEMVERMQSRRVSTIRAWSNLACFQKLLW
jgi:hypothetical protein